MYIIAALISGRFGLIKSLTISNPSPFKVMCLLFLMSKPVPSLIKSTNESIKIS
ncbi:hypothetical protein [Mycoplasmopsis felis]|uniref:hypothetical protein n=1 Tax=Mycoplasmopsis felis TaxID=33923 RepID=UPI0021AF91E1|nr:hypothetical protein [Mycoplasmopsis felis]UWV83784.1 hypothetical protein NWE58_05830 [Mycoplasmopsis felis]UWW00390.1 hypothetical protein NW064_03815 [Mycoplasmopsis felis]